MTEVIGVRFRGGCKEYFFDPCGLTVEPNRFVIVETAQGLEYAQCVSGNHEVEDSAVVQPLRPLVRLATENDDRTYAYNKTREKSAFDVCQKKIAERGLDMKLVRVESNFDGSKIIFFFTSDGRVDFRELVRDLAGVFRARIELRQIGVRDEAKMLGGLGICGRPFCCAQFLDDFVPVSIKMAKTQNLSLNPTKISGTCGRLMCCLKYEQNAYEDAAKRMPKNESFVQTPDGPGNVKSVNLLRETVKVSLDSAPEPQKCYHNCEICVLRNGKGSREGIEIPKERPERYVEEKEEPFEEPRFLSAPAPRTRTEEPPARPRGGAPRQERPDRPEDEERRGGGNRRRRRGGRGGGKKPEGAAPEQTQERTPRPAKPRPPRPDRPAGERPAEGRFAAGEQRPRPEKSGQEGAQGAHRPHHRGGRRRGRGGSGGQQGGGGTPAAE